ncbi:hypothetical protein RB595_002078 [Gaeumannomyces hyphopodioides]
MTTIQGPLAMAYMSGQAGLRASVGRLPQASPTACLLCQARRMQCDETKPGCTRCERMRINCPGYREPQKKRRGSPPNKQKTARRRAQDDAGDADAWKEPAPFVGRRWTTYTEKLESRWRDMPACPDEAFESDGNFTVMVPTPFGSIPTRVEVPIGDQARAFFLDNYVRMPTRPDERGSNSFILSILGSGRIEPCFDYAFRAASLAALSTRPSFRRLRAQAQVEYIRAIRAVGEVMQGLARGEGSKTQTLASVLLMAIYETLACPSQQMDAFEAHVRGAVQLIKLLGMENLRSQEGKEMLILARSRMLTLKVLPGHETSFIDTLGESLVPVGYQDILGQLGLLMASLAWQRGRMVQAIESCQYGPEMVAHVRKLMGLKLDISNVFLDAADSFERGDSMPDILARMRTSTSGTAPGPGAPCPPSTQEGVQMAPRHDGSPVLWPRSPSLHTVPASPGSQGRPDAGQTPETHDSGEAGVQMLDFADHKEASFYSACMAGSLLVSHTLVRCLAWISLADGNEPHAYESDPEYLLAAEMARRAIDGIVRCIRYYKTTLVRPTACASPSRPGDVSEFTMIASLSTLYAALVSQFCTEPQRRVLRAALQNIGDEGGIGQVSALLKKQCNIVPRDDIERDRDRIMRARAGFSTR